MGFEPYIHFQGTCAEALGWYAEIFGGKVHLMRYREAPDMPPEMAASDLIMHGEMVVNGKRLMASDYPPGMDGAKQLSVSVSYAIDDEPAGRELFEKLSEGGTLIMAWQPTFWAEGFGMVRDRFGTHWMISGPAKEG